MSVIGIDYGNMDCVLAQAKRGGIDIVLNENSNRKNPNLVTFQGKQRFLGEAAVSVARANYRNTAQCIKRLIGRKFNDPGVQREISLQPFKCIELPDGNVGIEVNYDDNKITLSCEQLVAMMLYKLRFIAESANPGVAVAYGVISVPGYFSDAQRRAMRNASTIAGVNCLQLMNEHAAVALAYGIYKSARSLFHETTPQHVMFIDMGNTSYTVSVVSFVQGKLVVKSVAYDPNLGGRDFDLAIVNHCAAAFKEKFKIDPMKNPKARLKLFAAAEKAKKNLSPQGVTTSAISVECLIEDYDYTGKLDLETFEEIIAPLLDGLEAPIKKALEEAKVEVPQLACVEIVGGGTRVSSVKKRISSILGLDQSSHGMGLSTTLNADESVARGCALQCAILSPLFKVKEFSVVDYVNYPIRVSWEQIASPDPSPMDTCEDAEEDAIEAASNNSILIFHRGDEFPKIRRITFRRLDSFEITAAYDGDANCHRSVGSATEIGRFNIAGIPATDGVEAPRIRVNVKQDLDGIFGVSSAHWMQEIPEEPKPTENADEDAKKEDAPPEEPKKKRYRKVELNVVSRTAGMTKDVLNEAVETEVKMAQQDRIIQETNDMRNAVESYIYDFRSRICDSLREFVSDDDKAKIEEVLQSTENWLYTEEGFDSTKSVYSSKLDDLKAHGDPIELRFVESTERPLASSQLLKTVEDMKSMMNSTDDRYSHLEDLERDAVRKMCFDCESWLTEQLDLQNALSLNVPPVLLSSAIRSKQIELNNNARPILTKPKPVPKSEPATGTASGNSEENAEGEENSGDNSVDGDTTAAPDTKNDLD